MNFRKLFNIVPPEEVKFIFPGKIGRNLTTWQNGEWIVTNRRIIFVAEGFESSNKPPFGRPMALVILLNEVVNIQKKKTKLVLKYSTYDLFLNHYDIKKINIGFLKYNFRNYNVANRSDLINLLFIYLHNPKAKPQQTCPTCGAGVPENETSCLNCDTPFQICEICKFPITEPDEQTHCPICKSSFHKPEFFEWIKIHGKCPSCGYQLNHERLVQLVTTNVSLITSEKPANPRLVPG